MHGNLSYIGDSDDDGEDEEIQRQEEEDRAMLNMRELLRDSIVKKSDSDRIIPESLVRVSYRLTPFLCYGK